MKIIVYHFPGINLDVYKEAQGFVDFPLEFEFRAIPYHEYPLIEYYPGNYGIAFDEIRALEGDFIQIIHNLQSEKNIISFAVAEPKGGRQFSQVAGLGDPTVVALLVLHEISHSLHFFFGIPDVTHDYTEIKNTTFTNWIQKHKDLYERLKLNLIKEKGEEVQFKFPLLKRIALYPPKVFGFIAFRANAKGERFIHHAQDYRYNYEPVMAMADGEAKKKYSQLGGNMLDVVVGDYRFEFAHLSKYLKLGPVKKGEVIAVSGNTGKTTGPHLHLAIYYRNEAIDPLTFNWEGDKNMYALNVIRNSKGEISLLGKGVRVPLTAKVYQQLGSPEFLQVTDEFYNSVPAGQALFGSLGGAGEPDGGEDAVVE